MNSSLVRAENLSIDFETDRGPRRAVRGIDIEIGNGEIVGLVGESGSGKTVFVNSIAGLNSSSAKLKGKLVFDGTDITGLHNNDPFFGTIRGRKVGFIFQDAMAALNPVLTVGYQIREAILLKNIANRKEAHRIASELLLEVGIEDQLKILKAYPHELSGGMKQRVMVAMAVACDPLLLIADEPTTALDVSNQSRILNLLSRIHKEKNITIILISHDLGVVTSICDRIIVLYAGTVVEQGRAEDIIGNPLHPYTEALLRSQPVFNFDNERLYDIKGKILSPYADVKGCVFADRCQYAIDICFENPPPERGGKLHKYFCHLENRSA